MCDRRRPALSLGQAGPAAQDLSPQGADEKVNSSLTKTAELCVEPMGMGWGCCPGCGWGDAGDTLGNCWER